MRMGKESHQGSLIEWPLMRCEKRTKPHSLTDGKLRAVTRKMWPRPSFGVDLRVRLSPCPLLHLERMAH